MDTLFALFAFVTLILMVVGLFSPKRSLFWSNKKPTRKRVLLIYSLAFIISMTLFDMTHSEENETTENAAEEQVEETEDTQENKETNDKEKKEEKQSDDQEDTSEDSEAGKQEKEAKNKSTATEDRSDDADSSSKEENDSSQKKSDSADDKQKDTSKQQDNSPDTNATVSRVVDGDTIEINYNGTKEDVRLLLVDTPEVHGGTQKLGPEASAFAKELLQPGTKVKYEADGPKRDHYGRLLGYLWVNGELFNEKLLENGLARYAYVYDPPYKYQDRLKQAEARARNKGIGIWSIEGYVTNEGFSSGTASGSNSGSSDSLSDSGSDSESSADTGDSTSSADLKYDPNGPDRDCGDFDTQAEAQAFYEAAGGPESDAHRLDGHDGDGVVCESLP